jgi:hypothetical protein
MHPAVALAFLAGLVWLLDEQGLDMAAVQKQFDQFHSNIKLDEDDENAKLREKRDLLIADLRARLPATAPTFTHIDLGSYAIGAGVLPLDRNYDIDVGLIFDTTTSAYPDPVALKKLVLDALNYGNRTVVMKRPCVTVNYMRDGKVDYHVDLSIYVPGSPGPLKLARGKESCPRENRKWLDADPQGRRIARSVPARHPVYEALARRPVHHRQAAEHRPDLRSALLVQPQHRPVYAKAGRPSCAQALGCDDAGQLRDCADR